MTQKILRPLDYGSLFDEVFDLYKNNFTLMAGVAGVGYIPISVLSSYTASNFLSTMEVGRLPNISAIVGLAILVALAIPISYATVAAGTWAVSTCYLGTKTTILRSYATILPRLIPFILTMLLVSVGFIVSMVLCCIPVLPYWLLMTFISEVFVLEGKSYIPAMERTIRLVASDWTRVLVVLILAILLAGLVQAVIVAPFQVIAILTGTEPLAESWLAILYGIAQGIGQSLATPAQIIASVLLYYDIRVRKEGFDIEMLAASIAKPNGTENTPLG